MTNSDAIILKQLILVTVIVVMIIGFMIWHFRTQAKNVLKMFAKIPPIAAVLAIFGIEIIDD